LQQRANQDILARVHVDSSDLSTVQSDLADIQAYIDSVNFQNLEIGAEIHDEAFISKLEAMVNAAGMSAEQAQAFLASIGVDAELEEHKATSTATSTVTDV
jgi:hypothetical protein